MLRLIGVMCSCIVTGYVFFDVMESLYERKFSYNKLTFTGIYVIYVILSVGIAWFGIPILNVLFSTLLLYGLSKSLYIAHDKSILINSGIIIIYLAIADIVVTVIFSTVLQSSTYNTITNPKYFWVSGIGNAVIILCTYKLVIQILQHCQINTISRILHFYMIFLMVFEFSILGYFVKHEIGKKNNIELLIVSFGVVILDAGILYLYKMLSKKATMEKRAELVEQQLEMTQRYYEGLQDNYEQMQQILHDTKKHIQVLSELTGNDKTDYEKELISNITEIQPQFYCSDKIVCAIIWNKMQICEQRRIEFEVNMQDITFDFMDKTDITALFANLLDNAVEACEESSIQCKKIILRIHRFKEYIVIKVCNTIGTKPKIKEGKLVSTKNGHLGMGMMILENLANKYCGNMDYEYSDTYFETNLILSVYNGMCER